MATFKQLVIMFCLVFSALSQTAPSQPKASRQASVGFAYIDSIPEGANVYAIKGPFTDENRANPLGRTPLVIQASRLKNLDVVIVMPIEFLCSRMERVPGLRNAANSLRASARAVGPRNMIHDQGTTDRAERWLRETFRLTGKAVYAATGGFGAGIVVMKRPVFVRLLYEDHPNSGVVEIADTREVPWPANNRVCVSFVPRECRWEDFSGLVSSTRYYIRDATALVAGTVARDSAVKIVEAKASLQRFGYYDWDVVQNKRTVGAKRIIISAETVPKIFQENLTFE